MICTIPELKKISVFHDGGKWPYKTIAEVKALTGADVVINGGLYNLTTRELCQTQKIDGRYFSIENEPYIGYGWNGDGADLKLTTDHVRHDNFISCINLPAEGSIHYPAELGSVRGRVAFGLKADGAVVIYCSKDSTADACIVVHHAEKIDGVHAQKLIIHYNCVGTVEIPNVLPLPLPEVTIQTRKGVAVSYSQSQQAVVNF